MTQSEAKTLAESAFRDIKADILQCRLPAGHSLRFDALREAYGVSLSPLREALSRLVSTGLVTAQGQRGFRVAEMSAGDLIDLTKTRIWVEVAALRSAIDTGDVNWEADIIAAAHRLGAGSHLRKTGETRALDEDWEIRHRGFHAALVSACTSRRLLAYREQLFDESDRYRRIAAHKAPENRDVAAEHRAIVASVLARDAERAADLMREHLFATMRRALDGLCEDRDETTKLLERARAEMHTMCRSGS